MADIKKAGSYGEWLTPTLRKIKDPFRLLTGQYATKADLVARTPTAFTIAGGDTTFERAYHLRAVLAASKPIYIRLLIFGMDTTSKAESEGLAVGLAEMADIVLQQLSEDIYSFLLGRMRQLGLNRTGKFLSKGSKPKEYIRYGRMTRNIMQSSAKSSAGIPYVSSFMNMGTRNTGDKLKTGAPHSPFVEYGFVDKRGKKHPPRPIFKLAKANMPAMVALAASKAEKKVQDAVGNAVNSRLTIPNRG